MSKSRLMGVLSASTMVYILATLSILVLLSTIYANTHLNSLLDVSRRLHIFVSTYIGENNRDVSTISINNSHVDVISFQTSTVRILQSTRNSVTNHKTTEIRQIKLTSKGPPRSTARPSECKACFEHRFDFILNNVDICQSGNSSIKVIVLIATVHVNTEKRKAIRETWLSQFRENTGQVRYAFLLGMTSDKTLQVALETESATYRDIIQEDFVDSYNNLTLKTMMAFRWATTSCQKAEFIMKTDDDMFVNLNSLMVVVDKHKNILQRSVGGYCVQSANPVRDKGSKWYVSLAMYPHAKYHGYCSGTGYVTSMAVAKKVFDISKHIPFFHLEDIYVGLCLNKLGFSFTRIPGFNPHFIPISCAYKGPGIITSHQVSPQQLRHVWNLKC
ncbi:beta-1,3-galactosyltransferase 1-like [Saccostrea echinata]|uniref:beta-1,3-galactosyltransferase 1-like n=1 Tax=Saccostrea echinata TaxID=191078 RepID=UPI002A7EE84A|nr:beta-1,3-galactosyltransferase 1-like [Saccostrea echinata]